MAQKKLAPIHPGEVLHKDRLAGAGLARDKHHVSISASGIPKAAAKLFEMTFSLQQVHRACLAAQS